MGIKVDLNCKYLIELKQKKNNDVKCINSLFFFLICNKFLFLTTASKVSSQF